MDKTQVWKLLSQSNSWLLTLELTQGPSPCVCPHLHPRKYSVYIPKFSIKTSYSLKDVLTEMGMADMFSDQADLSGIAEGQQLAVSEVRREDVDNNVHIFLSDTVAVSSVGCSSSYPGR